MIPKEQYAALLSAEFARVGVSETTWRQNFGPEAPFANEWLASHVNEALPVGTTQVLECPEGTRLGMQNGMQACIAIPGFVPGIPGGRVVNPEGELYPGPVPEPVTSLGPVAPGLPPFVGGGLGRVVFTPIVNRQLSGVRYGTLPQVVFGDVSPGGFGGLGGVQSVSGALEDDGSSLA